MNVSWFKQICSRLIALTSSYTNSNMIVSAIGEKRQNYLFLLLQSLFLYSITSIVYELCMKGRKKKKAIWRATSCTVLEMYSTVLKKKCSLEVFAAWFLLWGSSKDSGGLYMTWTISPHSYFKTHFQMQVYIQNMYNSSSNHLKCVYLCAYAKSLSPPE